MMTTSMLTTFRCVLTLLKATLWLSHCFSISKYPIDHNNFLFFCLMTCYSNYSTAIIHIYCTFETLENHLENCVDVCVCVAGLLFYLAGLQLREGVYCSSGSFARHSQRFLEDDLGEECTDSGHADTL